MGLDFSYEAGNPDNLPEEKHKSMMLMVFDKYV
jgi:hypothetical protein